MWRKILPPCPHQSNIFENRSHPRVLFKKKYMKYQQKIPNLYDLIKALDERKYKQPELSTVGQYSMFNQT